jgi:hypothetical protein
MFSDVSNTFPFLFKLVWFYFLSFGTENVLSNTSTPNGILYCQAQRHLGDLKDRTLSDIKGTLSDYY